MDIQPASNATIRETYSRLDVKQTVQNSTDATAGNNGDSVFLSQFLSYEQYTYSADIAVSDPSLVSPESSTGAAGQSDGAVAAGNVSSLRFGSTFLEIIQNRVKYLLEALAGNTSDSSGSGVPAAQSDTSASSADGTADSSSASYYSAEQTATRIVGFALAFFDGGDRTEFAAKVGDAVMKGYNQALEAMGGSLPDIVGDTISQVMDQLRQFASGGDVNTVV